MWTRCGEMRRGVGRRGEIAGGRLLQFRRHRSERRLALRLPRETRKMTQLCGGPRRAVRAAASFHAAQAALRGAQARPGPSDGPGRPRGRRPQTGMDGLYSLPDGRFSPAAALRLRQFALYLRQERRGLRSAEIVGDHGRSWEGVACARKPPEITGDRGRSWDSEITGDATCARKPPCPRAPKKRERSARLHTAAARRTRVSGSHVAASRYCGVSRLMIAGAQALVVEIKPALVFVRGVRHHGPCHRRRSPNVVRDGEAGDAHADLAVGHLRQDVVCSHGDPRY